MGYFFHRIGGNHVRFSTDRKVCVYIMYELCLNVRGGGLGFSVFVPLRVGSDR
jgi:hypothetical protein